jgi:hypothetical protein
LRATSSANHKIASKEMDKRHKEVPQNLEASQDNSMILRERHWLLGFGHSKVRLELGWSAEHTVLEEQIAKTARAPTFDPFNRQEFLRLLHENLDEDVVSVAQERHPTGSAGQLRV